MCDRQKDPHVRVLLFFHFAYNECMNVETQVSLAPYTTMRIGGPARYFVTARTSADVAEALAFSRAERLPLFVLGGGSNILVRDEGYDGLVLHVAIKGVTWDDTRPDTLIAGAGEVWDDIVATAVAHGYVGLENLSLIPGTVGGAAVQNIGAYGGELAAHVAWVEVYDPIEGGVQRLDRDACRFGYRDSHFKHGGKGLVVLRVAFSLVKDRTPDASYKDVLAYLRANGHSDTPSAKVLREAIIAIRRAKLPDLALLGTAGSFFMNPVVTHEVAERFAQRFPDAPRFPIDDTHEKLSAGWIIDHALGLRGVRDGAVGSYDKQALVLVNHGGATCSAMRAFADMIAQRAKDECAIDLIPEVIDVHA